MPQWVVHQAVTEGHHTVREVVLSQPCHHPLLLHVRPASHVDDEVAQVLPVSAEARGRRGVLWLPSFLSSPRLSCPARAHSDHSSPAEPRGAQML